MSDPMKESPLAMDRRTVLGAIAAAPLIAACTQTERAPVIGPAVRRGVRDTVVRNVEPLGFPWRTFDPFLFCAHHDDRYPIGNGRLGPAASLEGREIGSDFGRRDGWSMYHGQSVPGFPQHPHRGFETVTVVRTGLVDHSDSLGATARYGRGDVQWLTAGDGIQHAEMFPLVDARAPNPLDLFQIWLNLPRVDKRVAPHFEMLWAPTIPRHVALDGGGRPTEVRVIAGNLGGARPPSPPPHSWAARRDTDVSIVTLSMAPRATYTLPPAQPGSNRTLYFHRGDRLRVGDREVLGNHLAELIANREAYLENGDAPAEILMLQGRPIGEPVAQRGPFVMNTMDEIREAFSDYRRTQFGGWPWPDAAPVHGLDGRFARRVDGRIERAPEEPG